MAALNSYVDTHEIAGRAALANFLVIRYASADCSLINCAFNPSDADPTVLCSTNWQSSEWPSPTERQLSLLHNWLFWRDMHCMLNSTYTSSLVTTKAMGSNTISTQSCSRWSSSKRCTSASRLLVSSISRTQLPLQVPYASTLRDNHCTDISREVGLCGWNA